MSLSFAREPEALVTQHDLSPRAPNFFLVGTSKCGTTSLFHTLSRHPEVFACPVKEPGFFAPGLPVEPGSPTSWPDYLALFAAARSQRAVGEATTSYLATPGTAQRIRDRLPHARIVMVLRDPADRLFAYYVAARVAGASSSFQTWVEAERAKESARQPIFGVVWEGRYATHLRQYRDAFPASQLHVEWFEDYAGNERRTVQNCLAFLDLRTDLPLVLGVRLNETLEPLWPSLRPFRRVGARVLRSALSSANYARLRAMASRRPRLRPTVDERAWAIALYEEEIADLADMTGRDLSHWADARFAYGEPGP
jgi:Sulfotransferase domain